MGLRRLQPKAQGTIQHPRDSLRRRARLLRRDQVRLARLFLSDGRHSLRSHPVDHDPDPP